MDCLSDVLSTVHFKGTIYCQAEFTAPWGLSVGPYPGHTGFLMMVRGSCLIEVTGQTPFTLASGDLFLTPLGNGYTIKDAADSPAQSLEEVIALSCSGNRQNKQLKFGGGGTPATMIMGCFEFDTNAENPLIKALPAVLFVKAEDLASEPWLDTTFRFLAAETASDRQGSAIVISRLTDLLFIQAIRAHISQMSGCSESTGWFRAIADSQIGQALNLIHEKPEAPWTVASLAAAVNMSRSSFAARFAELVETGPLEYITSWRMQKAQELLRQNNLSLAEISVLTGYQSEPAFRKAFKRVIGEAPGRFRKSH
jgi:AraC-like DNA-binding protein